MTLVLFIIGLWLFLAEAWGWLLFYIVALAIFH